MPSFWYGVKCFEIGMRENKTPDVTTTYCYLYLPHSNRDIYDRRAGVTGLKLAIKAEEGPRDVGKLHRHAPPQSHIVVRNRTCIDWR